MLVLADDPMIAALTKISANLGGVVFLVDEQGRRVCTARITCALLDAPAA